MGDFFSRYPEFDDLTPDQRKRIFRRAYIRSFRHKETWIAMITIVLASVVLIFTTQLTISRTIGTSFWTALIIQQAFLIAGMFIFAKWNMRITARYMRASLPHLCINCGYDLRATPDRCPECGTERNAARAAHQPRG